MAPDAVDLDLSEIPPMVGCAQCGSFACPGCLPDSWTPGEMARPLELSWEAAEESPTKRLLRTALLTSLAPERAFGRLKPGSVRRALAFALLAETAAIASYALVTAIACFALFPTLLLNLAKEPFAWLLSLVVLLLSSGLLVVLHAVFGLMIEASIARLGRAPKKALGLRFGLYAVGWDLLTSPFGVVYCMGTHGRAFWEPVVSAMRVPRSALMHYLMSARSLSEDECQRVSRDLALRAGLMLLIALVSILGVVVLFTLRDFY